MIGSRQVLFPILLQIEANDAGLLTSFEASELRYKIIALKEWNHNSAFSHSNMVKNSGYRVRAFLLLFYARTTSVVLFLPK
jgi:hypothetical protein